jgi:hypothetical protein
MRARRVLLVLVLAVATLGCSSGSAAPSGVGGATPGASGGPVSAAPVASPITSTGPVGWDRGPYDLAGGAYELSWTSDGTCTVLYFGIVGVDNGFLEQPSTVGDVPLSQLKGGSRLIEAVPPGRYYFNVSGVACKTYTGTLTPKG